MSSFLAHVAAGLTLYFCKPVDKTRRPGLALGLPVLLVWLAIVPDFDYLAIWFLHARFELRVTHTLLFCFLISGIIYWLTARLKPAYAAASGYWVLLLAVCSHLVLDLLVGRSLPLLWPFVPHKFSLSMALLPGVSHTGVISYAFWRNLLMEACLLTPILAAIIMLARGLPLRAYLPEILLVLAMWSGLVFASGRLMSN
ncbi:metal-dependent hydrolase [Undibacterium pigrum]|uniref:LexA-binding, inner membrane-associated putative hydrolase n=1 Tax=Undibacterium pigrum TaxID=401470 RepID=A0A318IQC3_9BURK|nr:metal-dependent hydrolase [Undibacterium pigrum]PXX37213.1 LexA-binding, inner membrane-associated putative hydrolase [Undibacterium pigrum]